jgi:hypothetical protein
MKIATPDAPTAAEDADGVVAGKRYLTLERFARTVRRSLRTVARWNEQRIGPPQIKVGNLNLIDESKLPDWLAGHETKPIRPQRRRRSGGDDARPAA